MIWSDLVQVVLYVGAALVVLYFLWTSIPASTGEIVRGLTTRPRARTSCGSIDLSLDLAAPFSLLATVTGITLLFFASMGLDQDITQRFLACRDAREGRRALYASVLASIPVVLLFLAIGSLLYVFYDRPDLMGGGGGRRRGGGVRGREDHHLHALYPDPDPARRARLRRGRRARRGGGQFRADLDVLGADPGFLPALGRAAPRRCPRRISSAPAGSAWSCSLWPCSAMSVLCFYWQRYTEAPLLDFALAVMTFAYSGLLGVYFTLLFTRRGSSAR